MSTENQNFITVNSIAEIQDIVDGDYLFTISNGIIYKLDFQNFIISKNNTDFYNVIDSLSAQVVSNTQSLCAINGYINEEVKPTVDFLSASDVTSDWSSLSSEIFDTITTIRQLSGYTWLPLPSETEKFKAGAIVYYDGNAGDWRTIDAGPAGSVLTIDSETGVPIFSANSSSSQKTVQIQSGTLSIYDQNWTTGTVVNDGQATYKAFRYRDFNGTKWTYKQGINKTVSIEDIADQYTNIQINSSLVFSYQNNNVNTSNTSYSVSFNNRNVTILVGNPGTTYSGVGTVVLPLGNEGDATPLNISFNVKGGLVLTPSVVTRYSSTYNNSGSIGKYLRNGGMPVKIELTYQIFGVPVSS